MGQNVDEAPSYTVEPPMGMQEQQNRPFDTAEIGGRITRKKKGNKPSSSIRSMGVHRVRRTTRVEDGKRATKKVGTLAVITWLSSRMSLDGGICTTPPHFLLRYSALAAVSCVPETDSPHWLGVLCLFP